MGWLRRLLLLLEFTAAASRLCSRARFNALFNPGVHFIFDPADRVSPNGHRLGEFVARHRFVDSTACEAGSFFDLGPSNNGSFHPDDSVQSVGIARALPMSLGGKSPL